MYFFKTPLLIRKVFPNLLWQVNTNEKIIYLTFDDGPVPEATPWVLEQLARYNAEATFFMVGENIIKHPSVYQEVINAGHTAANHTYNHLKGWTTDTDAYMANFSKTESLLPKNGRSLFRPPYGQLKLNQLKKLRKETKIVMWDVLSGDFDKKISAETCLKKTIRYTEPGSIVVFHDSRKTIDLLKVVLPQYLEHFSSQGYKFAAL